MMRRLILAAAMMLAVFNLPAATRAWVDGAQASVGEELMLNLETDQVAARPDLTPLMRDFSLSDQTSSRSAQWVNGSVTTKTTYAIALVPRREGRLVIPAIRVGNEFSKPLVLQVVAGGAAPPASAAAQGNNDAFLETLIDDAQPYVQQSVGLTVRFNYSDSINSGSFGLDTPDGASLQQVGEDRYSTRLIGGREFKVAERSYVLVPERSGRLSIPAPQFQGRSNGDLFGQLFGGGGPVRLSGQARVLQVQPQPANVPQPWLPLRDLRLRYVGTAAQARVGEAATLTVEATAEGATRAQLPDLPTPVVDGAQVFADAPQFDESFVNGVPQVKLTQRYSVVPERGGKLQVQALSVPWFDVRSDTPQQASLPGLALTVAGAGTGAASPAPAGAGIAPTPASAIGELSGRWPALWWPRLAVGFALLWLLTLLWGLSRRHVASTPAPAAMQAGTAAATDTPWHSLNDLKQALDNGTLDEIGEVLRGMHAPPLADLDAVVDELDEPLQREAVELLRRARWADGNGPTARAALRNAFREGPMWRTRVRVQQELLAPLYPRR